MGLMLVVEILIGRLFKYFILTIFILLLAAKVKADSKKDTLVNVAWRDTVKTRKAQVFDTKESNSVIYYHPKSFQFITNIPSDIYLSAKSGFSRENLPKLGLILAGSGLLVLIDQQVTNSAQQFGRYLNLDPARKSKTILDFKIGGFNVNAIDIPDNTNSAIYYLGEGWTSILIAGGMYCYGNIASDYRALQSTSQIAESIFALGLTTQFLKRITGRQSPFRAMEKPDGVPGGDWHPFPNPAIYQKSVSNYDAFPSGHLATAMATVTILAGNFPDSKFIKPVGYSLMGLLGYAMLNNGVHWISDYPLAIAIGYTFGKVAVSRGSKIIPKIGNANGSSSTLTPAYFGYGGLGLSYRATF